jgi:hypothetical protein
VYEAGISTFQNPGRILGPEAQKQVGAAVSWEHGKNVTVACSVGASGNYALQMLIAENEILKAAKERSSWSSFLFQWLFHSNNLPG